jgi:23S rRNA-/tRNA-specific pseudouridylate synthase
MKTLQIDKADEGQRLDRYLRKYLPNAPLSAIYKLARTGKIKINGKRVNNEYRVEEGDLMDLHLTDEQLMIYQKILLAKVHPGQTKSQLSDWIIYEDESILAINKPAKINVHPGDHKSNEVSIIQMAHDYFEGKYSSPMFSPSLVHRIDRNTTGVLLIAKDRH